MNKRSVFGLALLLVPVAGAIILTQIGARDPEPKKNPVKPQALVVPDADDEEAISAPRPDAKPLGDNVKKGLAYLVNQQHTDGGWGQGGGWRQGGKDGGRVEGANVEDPSDLGNTCIAVLALMRAGNTPKEGEYAKQVAHGIDFILNRVEKADQDSLYLTDVRNTQLQSKIGPYVDTFLAQLTMSELKGKMPGTKGEERLVAAFDKTITKIAKHQKSDGNFDKNEAWASTLSMALCSKGINRGAQMGFSVPGTVLANDQKVNLSGLNLARGTFATSGEGLADPETTSIRMRFGGSSDAGVAVYRQSGQTSGLQEAVNTLKKEEGRNRAIAASPTAPREEKARAEKELERLTEAETGQKAAVDGLVRRLDDKQFIQGFGSNGGEEFLSYMNISETLLVRGGKEWRAWDKGISDALVQVQDKDGGWSGQHCITGRTFCTSTALLTLMADRAPIPVVKKDEKK